MTGQVVDVAKEIIRLRDAAMEELNEAGEMNARVLQLMLACSSIEMPNGGDNPLSSAFGKLANDMLIKAIVAFQKRGGRVIFQDPPAQKEAALPTEEARPPQKD